MEPVAAWGIAALQATEHELLLVAAVGILIFGIEDLLFDGLWLARRRARARCAAIATARQYRDLCSGVA